jgi:hypothetical protein
MQDKNGTKMEREKKMFFGGCGVPFFVILKDNK